MVEDLLQWAETNNSAISPRSNNVRMTHTEDTKSFSTVSAATLTTFMWMIKSQTHQKGMYCTLDFEQLQISVQVLSFLFHSSWQVLRLTPNILEACVSAECLLITLEFHTVTSYANSNTFFWNICERAIMILYLSSKNLSYGKNYTSFWLRTQTINIILHITYQKLVHLLTKYWTMKNYH